MVITNLKKFENICNYMKNFCKTIDKEKPCDNMFFIDKNIMISTNNYIMAVKNMNDCVINLETFGFPCNTKPIKIATLEGDKIIIERLKTEWYDKNKKISSDFNWKRIIPCGNPIILKEYDFSEYEIFKLKAEKKSKVTFVDDKVIFTYNDDCDIIAIYEDVVKKENDMFNNNVDDKITKVTFPMNQILDIMKDNKHFIIEQYDKSDYPTTVFKTSNYKFIIMPCIN